ncbi:MAG: hypothetical protein ABSB68_03760 [Acidimicrobiales bacterium]
MAVTIVLALLVGGLIQVSRQSQGYDANSNRSLAAQSGVVAEQSNVTASQVRSLMADLQTQDRQALQSSLDTAVQETARQSARVDLAAGSASSDSVPGQLAAVFAERAQSMTDLRGAVDGFLGMQSVPPAGSPATDAGTSQSAASQSALLSATQATNRIAAAGALLSRSDSLYRSVRRSLAAEVGHARLPASVWVSDPQVWQVGTVAAQVDLIATSSTLAPTHYVVLRTVRLNPPALPPPPGASASVSVLSPTSLLGVTVVVGNDGSSAEPRASVRLSLANQTSGATATQVESTALALGASVTLPTASFHVKPGTTYQLTVAVIPPSGQAVTVGTVIQQALQVAPAT